MKQHTSTARRAATAAALIAAAGLAMAGCKSSTTSSGSGNSSSGGSSASASSSSSASTGASGSGGGGTTASDDGAAYFPIGAGNTWVYETHLTSSSSTTTTNKMTKVEPDGSAQRVTMQVSTGLTGAEKPITVTYLFNSDGSITVPIGQLAGGIVKIKSGSIVWPSEAVLESGQPHTSTLVFDTSIAGHTDHVSAHVTVQGGGSQTVTVPAGTYHAHVINETFREKVAGISVSLRLKTWVANGVGPVKSDLVTKSGTASVPGTVEELKSFTKG
jgi:hypothetical protein